MTIQMQAPFYEQFLDRIPPFSDKMTLDALRILLNRLGNPQEQLQIIHIAGTNGKGSSTKMLSSIYSASGKKVGTYTSPYIMDYREIITINESVLSQQFMNTCTSKIATIYDTMKKDGLPLPSKYECITAIAFLAFSLSNLDLCIIETLMGGLNDATNVISKPLVSLITSISLDHTEYLGTTLSQIATQKAGIIKQNCPAIINKNPIDVLSVITKTCLTLHSPYLSSISSNTIVEEYINALTLQGNHQLDNLAGVLTCIHLLQDKFPISPIQIIQGLKTVSHPCRIEVIPSDSILYIFDGAHNLQGIEALADYLTLNYKKASIHILLGMLKDKDYMQVFSRLNRLTPHITTTYPLHPRKLDPHDVSTFPNTHLIQNSPFVQHASQSNPFDTFDTLKNQLIRTSSTLESTPESTPEPIPKPKSEPEYESEQQILVICGSFYLANPLKNYFKTGSKQIPKN